MDKNTQHAMDSLSIRLFKITNAAKEGKLGALRSDLPDHYIATDKVLIFYVPIFFPGVFLTTV